MFIPLIQKRRSIRRFLKKPVEPEKIELLIEAALRAPSSRGLNPWEFIVVSDREILKKLSKAKTHGPAFLKNAALGIVVCANPAKCDVWIEDASIASIFIHLAAESIGLGSCWIQIRERMHNDAVTSEEYVSEILNIPGNIKVESIVAIGYPAEKKHPHTKEALHYEKVHNNSFGVDLFPLSKLILTHIFYWTPGVFVSSGEIRLFSPPLQGGAGVVLVNYLPLFLIFSFFKGSIITTTPLNLPL